MSLSIAILTTDKREYEKDYANPSPSFGTAPEALLQGMAVLPELEVHVVSCLQQPVSSPKKIADNLWYHSLHVPKIGWLRTGYQGCIRAVRRKLKEIQPDIVHGQGTERDCAISAVLSGFPNVLTIHGNMVDAARVARARFGSFPWCAARLENFALKRTAGVFCNSRYTGKIVAARARQTWLVPNALRERFFAQPLPAGRKPRCVLLHAGEVCENKQQLKVLEVAGSLHRKNPGFDIWFLGSANPQNGYARAFLDRVRTAEGEGFARYLGKTKTVEELVACFDQASALIHTPIFEAFGLVVAEALARDLKLFAASVGGIVDIAAGVEGAELFAPNDWSGLETAIARWLNTGQPSPAGATALMRERYHPQTIARRHVEIYREVLNTRS
ncbi:MAG: glycosyltransferase family 4 protein [Verrucomicrobiia bacterium]